MIDVLSAEHVSGAWSGEKAAPRSSLFCNPCSPLRSSSATYRSAPSFFCNARPLRQ